MGPRWTAVIGAVALASLVLCAAVVSGGARAAAAALDCLPPSTTTPSIQNSGAINWTKFLRPQGPVKAIMLFVDYSDRPAAEPTTAVFDRYVPQAEAWYGAVSYGRVSLNVTPVNVWFRMPRASTGYMTRANSSFLLQRQLIQDAVTAADPTVNFAGYQLIYVVSPSGSGIDYSPAFTPLAPSPYGIAADGNILWHGATLGNDFYNSNSYGSHVLVHETGHTFGLPDLYNFSQPTFPYSTFVGDWDIMGNLDIGAGFLAWQRVQLGWVDPSQLACLTSSGTSDVRLSPIEQTGTKSAVVVQTGPTAFTVAENRQKIGEDAPICDTGLLVYSVDPTAESGRGGIKVLPAAPDDGSRAVLQCGPFYKAAFGPGELFSGDGGVAMKVMCAIGNDLVVRVAYGVPVDSGTSGLCPVVPPPPTGGGGVTPHIVKGTPRADLLTGTAGADVIDAGVGNDVVRAGSGNDRITAGPGLDRVYAGAGNDVVYVRDGQRDLVDCGAGRDTVFADTKDVVARNCEIVHRR